LPAAFQKDAVLRIDQRCFPRAVSEEPGIEHIRIFQNHPGLDEIGICDKFAVQSAIQKFTVAENRQRFDAITEVAPEFVEVLSARESARHPYDCDFRAIECSRRARIESAFHVPCPRRIRRKFCCCSRASWRASALPRPRDTAASESADLLKLAASE